MQPRSSQPFTSQPRSSQPFTSHPRSSDLKNLDVFSFEKNVYLHYFFGYLNFSRNCSRGTTVLIQIITILKLCHAAVNQLQLQQLLLCAFTTVVFYLFVSAVFFSAMFLDNRWLLFYLARIFELIKYLNCYKNIAKNIQLKTCKLTIHIKKTSCYLFIQLMMFGAITVDTL
jgi:hypothetical protein